MKQIMGEENDKQTNIQSRYATNHCLCPEPPCIWPRGHRNHGNLQHVLSPAHGKVVQSFPLLGSHQADTWEIADDDPQNLSLTEYPSLHPKFLQRRFDVLREEGPQLLRCVDVIVTSECIHMYFLPIVNQCL